MGLSVAIVALNEEANLGRTLASVRWADEIVVIDSGSTDRTCRIARGEGAEGILALEADEEVSPGLADEIRGVVSAGGKFEGYSMPRQNLFLGKWMRHGG